MYCRCQNRRNSLPHGNLARCYRLPLVCRRMSLRCLLFSSDEGTAAPILQVLTGLGVAGEHCSEAVATVEKVTHENFQIVIIDWDQQPEAALLLAAARERKAVERALTLAIVSDDVSVPQALQAGANSILRKPIIANHVRDTLTTARDLLRSKQETAANASQAAAATAAAGPASTIPSSVEAGQEKSKLRAGEFLHSAPPTPGGQFETETDVHESLKPFSVEPVDPLNELEPTAASVAHSTPASDPPPQQPEPSDPRGGEAKGLAWYLKTRNGALPPNPVQSSSSAAAASAAASAKPELLGYDQPSTYSPSHSPSSVDAASKSAPEPKRLQRLPDRAPESKIETKPEPRPEPKHEQKKEAELFAYMAGQSSESSAETPHSPSRLKRPIIAALVLAACAIAAAPQAPWHSRLRSAWSHGQFSLRIWLNPQPVTPVQAPAAHEDFARAGDEYKLPVAETIPDATTDPSQIQVLPVVDPTIKKGNPLGGNAEPGQGDGTGAVPVEQTPPSATLTPENQPPAAAPGTAQPNAGSTMLPVQLSVVSTTGPTTPAPIAVLPPRSDAPTGVSQPVASAPVRPSPAKTQEGNPALTPGNVPSSLKSHMVSMTPDAGGIKAPESAMPTIEPVVVPEASERALLTDQSAVGYPASARGQQGTVILQVLIGRDGTVQDAKFMQGCLAFARAAIDGVKQWKFKPYAMNGRPVSVQTQLTMSFKPGQ
jgi:TonB family protein